MKLKVLLPIYMIFSKNLILNGWRQPSYCVMTYCGLQGDIFKNGRPYCNFIVLVFSFNCHFIYLDWLLFCWVFLFPKSRIYQESTSNQGNLFLRIVPSIFKPNTVIFSDQTQLMPVSTIFTGNCLSFRLQCCFSK